MVPVLGEQKENEKPDKGYQVQRWWQKPGNELEYFFGTQIPQLGGVLKQSLVDPVVDAVESVQALDEGYQQVYRGTKGSSVYRAPDGTLTGNTPSQVEAQQGSIRAITQPLQFFGEGGQQARQALSDASADFIGATREEDLYANPDARRAQGVGQFFTETTAATVLTAGTLGVGRGAFARLSPGLQRALTRPFAGRKLLNWVGFAGLEGAYSGVFQDPFREQGFLFPVDPATDSPFSAFVKNTPSNALTDAVLGGTLELSGRAVSATLKGLFPNLARRQRGVRAQQEVSQAREWLEENDIQRENPDGTFERVEPPAEPEAEATAVDAPEAEAPAAPETEAAAPEANVLDDYEAAARAEQIEKASASDAKRSLDDIDDEGLERIAQSDNKIEAIEQELQTNAVEFEEAPQEMIAFPQEKLAEGTAAYGDQLEAISRQKLINAADPRNSRQLYQKVAELTGKDHAEFTKSDVIAGMKALQTEGIVFLPDRLQPSAQLMRVEDIKVDIERFQYKQDVDGQGRQKGESISDTEKWNTEFEGVIEVWKDPADGETYVVNGHNRLAKAKELGITSLPVRYINTLKPGQARARGAASNIASGSGTAFDAANYFEEAGINTPEDLKAAGFSMEGGKARQGLAIKNLPPSLRQDAMDGVLELKQAEMLGMSGLSDEDMIRVAAMSRDKGMGFFAEVLQMAQSPRSQVEIDQGSILGAEFLDTLAVKADLASRVRSILNTEKRQLGGAAKAKNAGLLAERANTQVDQGAAASAAAQSNQALQLFQRDKYLAGTDAAELLNQGTDVVANGGDAAVVADQIAGQLREGAEGQPLIKTPEPEPALQSNEDIWSQLSTTEALAMREQMEKRLLTQKKIDNSKRVIADADDALGRGDDVDLKKVEAAQKRLDRHDEAVEFIDWYDSRNEPKTREQRDQLKAKIIRDALDQGEIRTDPAIPAVQDSAESLEDLMLSPIRAIQEEIAQADAYARADAKQKMAEIQARDEANGYYEQDIQQQLDNGMLDDFPEPDEPELRNALDDYLADDLRNPDAQETGWGAFRFTRALDSEQWVLEIPELADLTGQELLELGVDDAGLNAMSAAQQARLLAGAWDKLKQRLPEGEYRVDATSPSRQKLFKRVLGDAYEGNTLRVEKKPPSTPDLPEPEGEPSYQLPADVAKSKPRYGLGTVVFGSDLDRAAYIIRSKSKKSKGEDRIIASLEEQGLDVAAVRKHGEKVKKAISDQVLDMTGSRRAPQSAMEIQVEAVPFDGGMTTQSITASVEGDRFMGLVNEKTWRFDDFREARSAVRDIIRRVAGNDTNIRTSKTTLKEIVIPKEHGGDGKQKGYSAGEYDWEQDLVSVYALMNTSPGELLETAYHEAWHRVQAMLLSKKEMASLNTDYAKRQFREAAGWYYSSQDKASIEMQAHAFQGYAAWRDMGYGTNFRQYRRYMQEQNKWRAEESFTQLSDDLGWTPSETADALKNSLEEMDGNYVHARAIKEGLQGRGNQANAMDKFMERLYEVFERIGNFARGNGFNSVGDLFERAYSGRLAKRRRFISAVKDFAEDGGSGRGDLAMEWLYDNHQQWLAAEEARLAEQELGLKQEALAGGC